MIKVCHVDHPTYTQYVMWQQYSADILAWLDNNLNYINYTCLESANTWSQFSPIPKNSLLGKFPRYQGTPTVKHVTSIHNQSINQSIKVICNARNVVHKLESEARAVASGRVLTVIEKVGLEASFESI